MNPFGDDDDGGNPFFETSKSSDFDSDSVFGKGEPEPAKPAKAPSPPPAARSPSPPPASNPQQSMIDFSAPVASTSSGSGSNSYGAILTGINDEPSYTSGTGSDKYNDFFDNVDSKPIAIKEEKQESVDFEAEQEGSSGGKQTQKNKKEAKKEKKKVKKVVKKKNKAADNDEDAEADNDDGNGEDEEKEEKGRHVLQMFYKISWYKPYFDIDTVDFFKRLLYGLTPKVNFFEKVGKGDFYGPFWVTTTLLLFLAIASNFAAYVAYESEGKGDEWNYNFFKLAVGAGVFYGYLIIIPIIFWAIQKFFNKAGLTLLQCFCAYGYSFTSYIIITLICIVPIEWVRWLVIAVAAAVSTMSLCAAFVGGLKDDMAKGTPVLIGIAVVHVALALVYKLYFFADIKVPSSDDK